MIQVGNFCALESPSWLTANPEGATTPTLHDVSGLVPSGVEKFYLNLVLFRAGVNPLGYADVALQIVLPKADGSGPMASNYTTFILSCHNLGYIPQMTIIDSTGAPFLAPNGQPLGHQVNATQMPALERGGDIVPIPNVGNLRQFYFYMQGGTLGSGTDCIFGISGWEFPAAVGGGGSLVAHTHPLAVGGSSVNTGEPVSG